MSRRSVLGLVIAFGVLTMTVSAFQGAPAPAQGRGRGGPVFPPLGDARQIKDRLYLIQGQGGNTLFFVMADGVAIVDTKVANQGQALLDRIRKVTDKPVRMVINTHTHGDHTGSNPFFGTMVERVAHENTRANMAKMEPFSGANANLLPNKVFSDKLSLGNGADRIDLYYFGPAHTNGDAFVVFPALRAMHGGDLFAWKRMPIVDRNNGGSGLRYGDTVAKAVAGIPNVDTVVTGHSSVMTWTDFVDFGEFNREIAKAVRAAYAGGKTAEQAAAELKLPAKFESWTTEAAFAQGDPDFLPPAARAKAHVESIYAELKESR